MTKVLIMPWSHTIIGHHASTPPPPTIITSSNHYLTPYNNIKDSHFHHRSSR
jgi:hypothetical protein